MSAQGKANDKDADAINAEKKKKAGHVKCRATWTSWRSARRPSPAASAAVPSADGHAVEAVAAVGVPLRTVSRRPLQSSQEPSAARAAARMGSDCLLPSTALFLLLAPCVSVVRVPTVFFILSSFFRVRKCAFVSSSSSLRCLITMSVFPLFAVRFFNCVFKFALLSVFTSLSQFVFLHSSSMFHSV